ncbi:hypothetical protein CBL_05531 [Carabus blaptoides fortunei]
MVPTEELWTQFYVPQCYFQMTWRRDKNLCPLKQHNERRSKSPALGNVYHPRRLIVHYLPTLFPAHTPAVPLPWPPVPMLLMTKSEVTALFILVTRHHFAPLMFSITTGAWHKHSGMLTLTTTLGTKRDTNIIVVPVVEMGIKVITINILNVPLQQSTSLEGNAIVELSKSNNVNSLTWATWCVGTWPFICLNLFSGSPGQSA